MQAGQRERQALRSRLRALQDERCETAAADASGIVNSTPSTSPADPAAASSGAGGVSAGGSVASSNKVRRASLSDLLWSELVRVPLMPWLGGLPGKHKPCTVFVTVSAS